MGGKLASIQQSGARQLLLFLTGLLLISCSGGGSGSAVAPAPTPTPTRSFLMGSTPFFGTPTAYPDWRFENLGDRDLLSLHVDDFWGVPWDQCNPGPCANLPASWVSQWQQFAANAHASGKTLYLAVSPLSDRKTLAGSVQANGAILNHWVPAAAVDASGCYKFAEDASNAAIYQAAYINYLKYVIDLVQPKYFSPAIEMNMPFTSCAFSEIWRCAITMAARGRGMRSGSNTSIGPMRPDSGRTA